MDLPILAFVTANFRYTTTRTPSAIKVFMKLSAYEDLDICAVGGIIATDILYF